jgi:hypothetical protein
MANRNRRTPDVLMGTMLLVALMSLVGLARRDRHRRPHLPLVIDNNRTIRLPVPELPPAGGGPRPPLPADIPEAAAELERAADAANEARAGLEDTKRELEHMKRDLEGSRKDFDGLRADADARQKAAQQELAAAQRELEAKRAEMEKAAQNAEQRLARARQELEALEQQRLAAGAQAGIVGGLGRGPRLDMQVRADPRRVRNPALPPFAPNDAAVAAAGPRVAGGGGGGLRGPLFSTTAQGDMLQGQAALVEAQGSYAIDTSKAAINAQTARAMSLDNHLRTAETFFEARRINRINRAYEAGPAVTLDQVIRMASAGLPPRPTDLQLDRNTGDISWPRLLRDPTYGNLTSRIQQHFHDRSVQGGSLDFTAAEDCDAAFAELAAQMRDNVRRYPSGEYGAARTFLDGLRREYDLPLDD